MAERGESVHDLRVRATIGCLASLLLAVGLFHAAVSTSLAGPDASFLVPDWLRTFGTAGADEGWGLDVGPDGDIYLAGFVQGQGNDVFLVRMDALGNIAWETTWNRPFSQKAFEVRYANGFLYVGGASQRNFAVQSQDMLLLKVWASNGTVVWDATWNGPADLYDEIDGIVVEDGYVFVSGWADVPLDYTEGDLALVKFTEDGAYVAHSLWGGTRREEANGGMASDGWNLYVAGIVDGVNLFTGGDAVLVAFNKTTLTEVWNRTWGGAKVDDGFGLTLRDGDLYVTGLTTSFEGDRIFLLKYDTQGNPIFNATWGGTGAESARAVDVLANETGIYIAGKTSSYGNGSFDVVLLRFDSTGVLDWFKTWGGTGSDGSHAVAIEGETVYIAGDTSSQGGGGSNILLLAVGLDGGPSISELPPSPSDTPAALVAAIVLAILGATIALVLVRRRRRPPR